MDRLTAMQVFVETVERGSLTAAAERLGLTRATASRYLAELERWLGARLLHRSTRSLSLTSAGEEALIDCRQMLQVQEKMLAGKLDHSSEPKGALRITCSQSFSQAYLSGVIADYSLRYPQVNIDIQLLERSINLVDERIDLAIRITNTLEPGIIAKRLALCHSVVCASPEYLNRTARPQTPDDLAQHTCLTHSQFSTHSWSFYDPLDKSKMIRIPIKGRICANEAMVLKQAALAGVGVTLLPTYLVKNEIIDGTLEVILPEYKLETLSVYAIYTSRNYMSLALRALLNFLDERFKSDAFWQGE
ncbi:LysR family transcriptional regulator [Pragia fontium]|uniref:DNA-binding transcriptional regulator, LysR family n=1 Tax=Pragia fontium DSM 5563 = ATCC 49100 TaxID=1122977 RepID=A0AAJ5BGP4_9GAMM|nr:LysR family transcriptional regulator [Pragia fontium]AKJ43334.1 LysR family transcriptional regulator [Pragia fontium]SFC57461.1 DNA-binding transcriptional regulator, LysR family [Pragia fontium DSM 5563 = ATCC 49100]SUB83804.1 D-malate degradation protein R [Pragia fontium]VEJ56708.1 D-malate degradation protein R [Pragia fontium]